MIDMLESDVRLIICLQSYLVQIEWRYWFLKRKYDEE